MLAVMYSICLCNFSPMKFAFCVSKVIVHPRAHSSIHPSIHLFLLYHSNVRTRSFDHAFYCSLAQWLSVTFSTYTSHCVAYSKLHMIYNEYVAAAMSKLETVAHAQRTPPIIMIWWIISSFFSCDIFASAGKSKRFRFVRNSLPCVVVVYVAFSDCAETDFVQCSYLHHTYVCLQYAGYPVRVHCTKNA